MKKTTSRLSLLKHSRAPSLGLALCALVWSMAAQAQTGNPNRTSSGTSMYGLGSSYVGLNAGRSNFSLNNGLGGFSADKRANAYNLYGGGYFNDNLGVELGYADFGRISRAGGTTRAQGFNASLVGKMPVASSFNLLGRLGTTYGRTDVTASPASGVATGRENGFGVSYGLGAEYLFNPTLSGVLQYDEYRLKFAGAGRERVNTTSLGLRYRF